MHIHLHIGKTTKDASSVQPSKERKDYAKQVIALLGISPRFVDPMTNGYRIFMGQITESEQQSIASKIRGQLGITVSFRKRGGYGKTGIDMIVPFKG